MQFQCDTAGCPCLADQLQLVDTSRYNSQTRDNVKIDKKNAVIQFFDKPWAAILLRPTNFKVLPVSYLYKF